ncbi:probable beta-1,4-xylosyltransferase IRX9 [Oryza brachyantha]|uniref:probable beta-1,4-xylosyltransferase IRX9 n=1 Tax=Oryza brachyantha TaxID=4533 RepID=UPI0007761023|nr:probable beta-1,4-xylosyltransferase IRX9 [Oryza brachyantha]
MAAPPPCKTNRSRPPLLLRRAMLHSSLCFLVGLLAGLDPFAVFLRALNNRTLIVSSRRHHHMMINSPQLVVVVTTTEQSDPERRAAGLTRTAHALRLVSPPLLWLVVEVAPAEEHAAPPTARLLRRTGVVHRHLMYKKEEEATREKQRNVALRHIEDHRIAGVVLFGGLDDVYDLRLLHRLRDIRTFGAWPVATVSAYERKVAVQGPLCEAASSSSTRPRGWFDLDHMQMQTQVLPRPPPETFMDVAGFAFSSWLLWDPHRWDRFPLSEPDTSQESVKFVQRLAVEEYNKSTTMGMPDSACSQIMLWRIRTVL